MNTDRHSPSGPEGTLSAIGCALFFIFIGVVIGVGVELGAGEVVGVR